ncbi:MAG: immunoglobulin domain-containing protein, partial [Verrucomicrobia bacterium]|nr:immunoglobulin domain-containing protein [Verrucomicrobiota bacterium]
NIVDNTGIQHKVFSTNAPVVTNVFAHVALTYDKASGIATIYCNGNLVGQQNLGSFTPQTSYDLYLGRRPFGGADNYTFNGLLDECSLYNRALSSSEVAAIFSAGSAGKCTPSLVGPVITFQPTNLTVTAGNTATFTVAATGSAPLSYQWTRNNTNLPAATNSTLTLLNVQMSQAGNYAVIVSNVVSSVVSSNAVLTVNAVQPPPSCTPAPSGIVAWWQAESNATDIIGGHNGALSASGATYAAGEVGLGFRLDGTNGYVQIPDSAALKPANVTVEAWVWLQPNVNTDTGEYVIFKRNTWTYLFEGYSLAKSHDSNGDGTSSDHFQFVASRTGNQVIATSKTVVQRGVWYHVAGTYDGNKLTIYVNGVAEASAVAGFALDYDTLPVFLGTSGQPAPYQGFLAGIIDEPSVYNRALATNEIAAIYSAGSAGKCTSALVGPAITSQPTNLTVTAGSTATFTVAATGSAPLSYQW